MRHLKPVILTVLALVLLSGTALWAAVHTGRVGVTADGEHLPLTAWLLDTARRNAVQRRAATIDVRLPDRVDRHTLQQAAVAYEDMCAGCHAPPGRATSVLAQGLNPAPPDLAEVAAERSPAELFWVTRHGIRMTGMPAWGATHTDEELWPIVALVERFPGFEGDEYAELLAAARAAGAGHEHGVGGDHGHASSPGDDEAPGAHAQGGADASDPAAAQSHAGQGTHQHGHDAGHGHHPHPGGRKNTEPDTSSGATGHEHRHGTGADGGHGMPGAHDADHDRHEVPEETR